MQLIAHLIPAVTVLLLAVIGMLPWGHGQDLRFCLPSLAFIAIHYWQHRHARLVPPTLVAAVGLAIDVVTSGPLGYWALVLLAGLALTWIVDWLTGVREGVARWLGFIVASLGLSAAAWLVASAYFVHAAAWRPMLVSVAVQAIVYPFLALLLGPLARFVDGPRPLILERRR